MGKKYYHQSLETQHVENPSVESVWWRHIGRVLNSQVLYSDLKTLERPSQIWYDTQRYVTSMTNGND